MTWGAAERTGRGRRAIVVLGVFLAEVWVSACGPTPIPDRRRELLRSWCERFLLERYGDFIERSEALHTRTQALESEPTSERLHATRVAWSDARRPFKEAEVFAFGPAIEEPQRYGPKIDFWPVRTDDIEAAISDEPFDAARVGASAKGLPAIEYLLFGPNALEELRTNDVRRDALTALTEDLVQQARGLRDAWHPERGNFQGELIDAGIGSTSFDTLPMALSEVVNRMGFTVEAIRGNKLEAGIAPGGRPAPERLESQYSGRSIHDILDNLRGIEVLFFGDVSRGIQSLDALLQRRGHHLGPALSEALRAARAELRRLEPLTDAVSEDPEGIRRAAERLGELQRLIQVDVLGALSLGVRFSDNDGD